MLGLDNYGSDAESDTSDTTPVVKPAKSSLSSILPPPGQRKPVLNTRASSTSNGLNLPPPKAKGKKREGPLKITVELPKLAGDSDEPKAKKPRLDVEDGTNSSNEAGSGHGKKGAGSSSLLSMLPAPKKVAPAPEKPVAPQRMLGSGVKGEPTGLIMEDYQPALPSSTTSDSVTADAGETLSFLPPHLRNPRNKAVPASKPPEPQPKKTEDDGMDFFSLGAKPTLPSSKPSTSKAGPSASTSHPSSVQISAAPSVKDYEPPPPTPYDPYPGYYQLPSGQWAAYDPTVYKKYWDEWNAAYAEPNSKDSGKEGKGWEGADRDDLVSVNALEELARERLAEKERTKNITAPPTIPDTVTKPNMKTQKAGGLARSRHQLSTLLAEAYENRAAIEEKIAQGRRNQKEAGNKYGF
ncbi:hypothetical protein FRC03_000019 [Tulasnella sp. 419]|nr:hypothetical protein FRC03_000019 [Tulasnella sp. 419]